VGCRPRGLSDRGAPVRNAPAPTEWLTTSLPTWTCGSRRRLPARGGSIARAGQDEVFNVCADDALASSRYERCFHA
jgi:hypothetical protein